MSENTYKKALENFKNNYYKQNESTYKELATGQSPETLFITCSDSRICPNHLTSTGPGELFVIRNAGNVIKAFDENLIDQEAATIEYAVEILKVKNIVICGHKSCGAMGGILSPDSLKNFPLLTNALAKQFDGHRNWIKKTHANHEPAQQVDALVKYNVIKQMNNLMTYPCIKKAVDASSLTINGWIYDFVNGEVETIKGDEHEL